MLALLGLGQMLFQQTSMQAGDEEQVLHVMHDAGRELVHHAHLLRLCQIGLGLLQRPLLEHELVVERCDLIAKPILGLPQAINAEVGTDPVQRLPRIVLDGRERGKKPVVVTAVLLDAQPVARGLLRDQRA